MPSLGTDTFAGAVPKNSTSRAAFGANVPWTTIGSQARPMTGGVVWSGSSAGDQRRQPELRTDSDASRVRHDHTERIGRDVEQTPGDYVEWEVEASRAGRYEVRAVVACKQGDHGGRLEVRVDDGKAKLSATVPSTGTWKVHRELSVGAVRLEPGVHRISVHKGKASGPLMKLRSLRLVAQ